MSHTVRGRARRARRCERAGRGLHGRPHLQAARGRAAAALQVAGGRRDGSVHPGGVVAALSRSRARRAHRSRARIEPEHSRGRRPGGRGARARWCRAGLSLLPLWQGGGGGAGGGGRVRPAGGGGPPPADDVGVVRLTVETGVARFYSTLRALAAQAQILTDTVTAYAEQV